MAKKAGSKFDDYSISPKIRQILLHWGYELKESIVIWGLRATFFFLKNTKKQNKTPEKHKTLSKKHKDT